MQMRRLRHLFMTTLGLALCILLCKYVYNALRPGIRQSPSYVVIFTTMRSGSTFAGSLLEYSPDVFYTFESLYALHALKKSELRFLIKPTRKMRDWVHEATSVVNSALRCQFGDLDIESLTSHHLQISKDTKPYFKCIEHTWRNASRHDIIKCLHLLKVPCSRSRVRVVKEIRLPIQSMDAILGASQSMKMIHLIRDPRAVIRSQMMHGLSTGPYVYPYAKMMCSKLLQDVIIRERLQEKYPGQVKVLFYENLAQEPIRITKQLYDFVGLSLTADTEYYVRSITSGPVDTSCGVCVYKTNSTYESQKWRMKINAISVRIMDRVCAPLYKKLGYLPLESEEHLRNLHRPLLNVEHLDF